MNKLMRFIASKVFLRAFVTVLITYLVVLASYLILSERIAALEALISFLQVGLITTAILAIVGAAVGGSHLKRMTEGYKIERQLDYLDRKLEKEDNEDDKNNIIGK